VANAALAVNGPDAAMAVTEMRPGASVPPLRRVSVPGHRKGDGRGAACRKCHALT
jgi:hypothetical protein